MEIKSRPSKRIKGNHAEIEPLRVIMYRCKRCGKRFREEWRARDHARRCRCFNCCHYLKRRTPYEPGVPLDNERNVIDGFGCLLKLWRWADNTYPPVECDKWETKLIYTGITEHKEDDDAEEWVREIPEYRQPVKGGKQ